MAHKAHINGTDYDITGGRALIAGTGYGIAKGRTLIGGTGYDITFPSAGTPLSGVTPGSTVLIGESGSAVEFYVARHDYESALNGAGRTLLVRKECLAARKWHSVNSNAYATSTMDKWLNGNYKATLSADVLKIIGTTKIKYSPGNGTAGTSTLERAVFLLSATELGQSESWFNTEGAALDIAGILRIAYRDGSAVRQWTRTPDMEYTTSVACLYATGSVSSTYCTSANICPRPAFTLPGTTLVDGDGNIIG